MTRYEILLKEKELALLTTNCYIIIYDENHMEIYNSNLIKMLDVDGVIYKPYFDNLSKDDKLKICYCYQLTLYQNIYLSVKNKECKLFDQQWESILLTYADPNFIKDTDKENKRNYNYIINDKSVLRKIKK